MMKRHFLLLLLLAAVLPALPGCKDTKASLPSVSGKAGEIIVVMEKPDWEDALGNDVRDLLACDCPWLAQQEPLYSLINITPSNFVNLFKVHRNIILFQVGPQEDSTGIIYKHDVWAAPQCVIQLSAPTPAEASALLKEKGPMIVNSFEQAERDRVIRNTLRYEEHALYQQVAEIFGGSPHFPSGYRLRKATDDFVWIADDKQYVYQDVFVYRYPAEADPFTLERIIAHRNEILKDNVPGMIDGYGRGGGFEFSITNKNGADLHTFYDVSQRFLEFLNQRPEVSDAYSGYAIDYPQYRVDVDASRCKKLGVSPSAVLNEMGAFLSSSYVSNFNKYNQVYQVTMQLLPTDRADLQSLDRLFVRSTGGEMLPLSQFVTFTKEYMPQSLDRFNMVSCIGVSGSVPLGSSTGDAIRAIREVAQKELPVGYGIEFGGITREESQMSGNIFIIFIICTIFVYLIMVALYESLFIPLAVILGVPFGLMGSFLFAKIFGVENNIYLQVGLIMLIGLLSKTAILLTEYATQCRHAGMSLKQSAFFAAKMRLRPILMTSLTMIFGMLPLMFASGAGANGSRTVGVGTVGGMLLGTIGLLFVVPALFVIFQTLQERFKPISFQPSEDTLIIEEMKNIASYTHNKKKEIYDE